MKIKKLSFSKCRFFLPNFKHTLSIKKLTMISHQPPKKSNPKRYIPNRNNYFSKIIGQHLKKKPKNFRFQNADFSSEISSTRYLVISWPWYLTNHQKIKTQNTIIPNRNNFFSKLIGQKLKIKTKKILSQNADFFSNISSTRYLVKSFICRLWVICKNSIRCDSDLKRQFGVRWFLVLST